MIFLKSNYLDQKWYLQIIIIKILNLLGRFRLITVDYGRLRLITVDYGRLGNDKKDVLIYLLDHGSIARKKVMELLDSKSSKATDLLAEMVEENLITRKGSGRGTYYVLKK